MSDDPDWIFFAHPSQYDDAVAMYGKRHVRLIEPIPVAPDAVFYLDARGVWSHDGTGIYALSNAPSSAVTMDLRRALISGVDK